MWPNPKYDERLGVRFDWGQKFQHATTKAWYRNVVLQLNANAENEAIKEAVQKQQGGAHAKRATAEFLLNDDGTGLHSSINQEVFQRQFIDAFNEGF